jgi:hypothetical protein
VPSSAAAGAARREEVLALLRDMADNPPGPLQGGLSADHRLVLQGNQPLAMPVTARALVGQVVRFLLDVAPYLDVAGEAGVTPTGTVKT